MTDAFCLISAFVSRNGNKIKVSNKSFCFWKTIKIKKKFTSSLIIPYQNSPELAAFLTACFSPLSCLVCVYSVIERKAHRTYLHIHLNASLSSMGSVGIFTNSIPLLTYFELIFTTSNKLKKKCRF